MPARNDVLKSPEFLEAQPYNKVFTESVPRLKDFWNLPEYAKLLNVHSTQVNAAISGTQKPDAALDKLASEEQADPRRELVEVSSITRGAGRLRARPPARFVT